MALGYPLDPPHDQPGDRTTEFKSQKQADRPRPPGERGGDADRGDKPEKVSHPGYDHTFYNDTGSRDSAEAAKEAWARTLAWLESRLSVPCSAQSQSTEGIATRRRIHSPGRTARCESAIVRV
jgi:hypothetical protein